MEVGASLGGCTWRVLTLHPRAVVLAVEPYQPAADALRMTALENGLSDRLTISRSFVSTKSKCPKNTVRSAKAHIFVGDDEFHQLKNPARAVDNDCATATLSEILESWSSAHVDLLRIHVAGFELDVLKSAAETLHKIRCLSVALWTHRDFPKDYDPAAVAGFLQDSGCSIVLHFVSMPDLRPSVIQELRDDAVVFALAKSEILTLDTMDLMAFCGDKRADSARSEHSMSHSAIM